MYQSGRAEDEVKKRKSPAKSGRVGITVVPPSRFLLDISQSNAVESSFFFVFHVPGLLHCNGQEKASLAEILKHLQDTYCRQLSLEVQHVVVIEK